MGGTCSPGLLITWQRTRLALEESGGFTEQSMANNGQKTKQTQKTKVKYFIASWRGVGVGMG